MNCGIFVFNRILDYLLNRNNTETVKQQSFPIELKIHRMIPYDIFD